MGERVDAIMTGHETLPATRVNVAGPDAPKSEVSGPSTVGRGVARVAPPNNDKGVGRLRLVAPVTSGNRGVTRLSVQKHNGSGESSRVAEVRGE